MKIYCIFIVLVLAKFCSNSNSKTYNKPNQTDTIKIDTFGVEKIKKDTVKKDIDIEVIEPAIIDTIVLGDINNDKVVDTAFIYTPPTIKHVDEKGEIIYQFGCVDNNCFNKITFSCKIPEIYVDGVVWSSIENIGDLNNDGYNELIFSPGWFTSCWGNLYIYTYTGTKWKRTTNVSYRRCEGEPLKSHVLKIKNKYYLQGIKFEDGDDVEYKIPIKLK